jgi:MFS family permease
VLVPVWIAVEVRQREALVDMRMMRLRGVWTTNATAVLIGAGLYGSFIAGRLSSTVGSKLPLVLGSIVSAGAFVLLTLAHSRHFEVYLGAALMGAGIGLAFSAMANLIVEAVPREQTGVATGMNTIMRTIGGSVGSTLSAVVITSSLAATALPRERGFTLAFAASAIALAGAAVAALAVPQRRTS